MVRSVLFRGNSRWRPRLFTSLEEQKDALKALENGRCRAVHMNMKCRTVTGPPKTFALPLKTPFGFGLKSFFSFALRSSILPAAR